MYATQSSRCATLQASASAVTARAVMLSFFIHWHTRFKARPFIPRDRFDHGAQAMSVRAPLISAVVCASLSVPSACTHPVLTHARFHSATGPSSSKSFPGCMIIRSFCMSSAFRFALYAYVCMRVRVSSYMDVTSICRSSKEVARECSRLRLTSVECVMAIIAEKAASSGVLLSDTRARSVYL